jgi:surfeit locus 1 family protein
MDRENICKKFIFKILPNMIVLLTFIILLSLGNWQIRRLEEKQNFIETIESNLENSAKEIETLYKPVPLYSKVKIEGKFLRGQDIFLYGRRSSFPEKDGYYLFTPFAAKNGKTYMVSRGWMPQTVKVNLTINKDASDKMESIEAVTLPSEKRGYFVPENDVENNVWFTMDLNIAANTRSTNVKDFYLLQINSDNIPHGVIPLKVTYLSKVRNDHLEYAITWYALAICLLIMRGHYLYKLRK